MKEFRTSVVFVIGLLLFASGYLLAQGIAKDNDKSSDLALEQFKNETDANLYVLDPKGHEDKAEAFKRFSTMYGRTAADTEMQRAFVAQTLNKYYVDKAQAKSAQQSTEVMQEAALRLQLLQSAQNQRIINLLEKIAAEKK